MSPESNQTSALNAMIFELIFYRTIEIGFWNSVKSTACPLLMQNVSLLSLFATPQPSVQAAALRNNMESFK